MLGIRSRIAVLVCGSVFVPPHFNNANAQELPRPMRVRISTGVMLGLMEKKPMPVYPDEAMLKGIRGDVVFKVRGDDTGKIVLATPIEGAPLLVAASVEALRDSHFRPYLLNGTAVAVETQLGFQFSLEKEGGAVNGKVDCMTSLPTPLWTAVDRDEVPIVVNLHKISGPEPKLPTDLAGKTGSVYLLITVGADGKVQDVKVVGGDEAFVGPVVEAVKQDVYEPRMVDGKPTAATIEASYHFGPRR